MNYRPIRVIFLCTGNSARSVMAEALLRNRGKDDFEVYSAGTQPKGLNPFTAKVLEQANLDITGFRSQNVSEFFGQKFDYVITVCDRAAEECPVFPDDPTRIHWSFPDPAAVEGNDVVKLAAFQATLREMRQRIDVFYPVALRYREKSPVMETAR
ncbi:MAG TPA: arsenate reductase ArsC [Dehalococcoidia bacterium]|nr:arsenate reductase ArsC [Dehalococcoidia bacterium]